MRSTGAGCYTDDTQMSLALAEVLLKNSRPSPLEIADGFVQAFQRDPRAGYAPRFYAFLQSVSSGQDFLDHIQNTSDRNGAAMRSCPVGFLPTEEQVLDLAKLQACITHNTPTAIAASQGIALMTHHGLYQKGPKHEVGAYLNHWVGVIDWTQPHQGKIAIEGLNAAHAAVSLVLAHSTLKDMLWHAIDKGGDTDSGAAMAVGAASVRSDIIHNLPPVLEDTLENDMFGKEYIKNVDMQIYKKYIKK